MIKSKKIDIKKIAAALKRGAIIVYPTDTAYALGCDATNRRAVAMIFRIKGRNRAKGLPLILADIKMAKIFFRLSTQDSRLATRFWPGPLSIVLKAKKVIAKAVLQKGTAAVRVPASEIARDLSRMLKRPLVATSANISGAPACYSIKSFLRQFGRTPPTPSFQEGGKTPSLGKGGSGRVPDLILDAGYLPRRRPSTIVLLDRSGRIEVLRKGPIRL
jgi:L-threonylcarbamoyladenylate synthase